MGSQCCKCANGDKQHRGSVSSIYRLRGDVPMPSDRYQIQTRGNVVQLTLKQSQKEDSGHYALVAKKLSSGLSISGDERAESRHRIRLSIQDPSSIIEEGEPPIFLRRPSDLAVKVGTRTRFLVEIRSSTSPKVTWHKNDEPLQSGSRLSFVHEGNFYCVDVAPVMVDDQGHWTCMAENGSGRSSCTSFLSVIVPKAYKKPEFVEELRAILTETGTVSLECKVVGVPTPVLKWFKDQKEIKAGDVFALTANPDDPTSLGTYTCEAVNCMGTAYSSSRVHVMGKGSREGSLKPADALTPSGPLPVFRQILRDESCRIGDTLVLACQVNVPPWPKEITWYNKEGRVEPSEKYHLRADGLGGYSIEIKGVEAMDEGEWKCVATSIENMKQFSTCHVAMSIPKNYRMPRFMESLKAVLTEEGLVSFECKVVGFPTPLLRWFKDGQELHPGDVYQLTGTNSLGSYCCIARNCMGEAKSVAELTVEDIQNQLNEEERMQLMSVNQAPKFVKGLRSCEARINEDFTFTIQVSVSPEPSLSWYRDDVAIIESERYRLAREALGTCNLEVKRLEFVDQAEWKCVAANDFGHSVTSCFLKLVIPKHFKKPKFLESLRAILSEEGAVNLECKVIGVPQPILKWYKDGIELKPGDIHRIISGQDGTCCLGTYTCEATNCMGSVSSSASLLGFEDRVSMRKEEAKEPVTPLHELARNLSLSTIHEERTSQLYDTPQTDHSITMDDRGEVSFSFDGKEVSVSLYETPDLTEEEALQIVEMYADQLSEHITEGNVIELPPMRFVKETSTTGNLLMEAVVIDVSPDYFVPDEEGDDLRTEADVEDVSIMDDQMQSIRSLSYVSSPTGAETSGVPSGSPPSRPPRRKESRESFSSRSERSDRSLAKVFDWSESYHSARDPSMQAHSSAQAQDDSGEAFTDALSSSARSKADESREVYASLVEQNVERIGLDETIAEVSKRDLNVEGETNATQIGQALIEQVPLKKKKRKRKSKSGKNASRTPSLSSKASSEESYSPDVEDTTGQKRASDNGGERRGSLTTSDKSGKDRESGSESGNFETAAPSPDLRRRESDATIMVDDVRIEQIEDIACIETGDKIESREPWKNEQLETREPTSVTPELFKNESERSTLRSNKDRLLESVHKLSEPIMSLRNALVDLDNLLPLLQTQGSPDEDEKSRMEIEARIVQPVENLCEQVSAIETKALKSAGDRSLAQNVRISLLEIIGGPTEELLRGIELIRRHSGHQDAKSNLIVLESLTDPVDEILVGLTKVEKDLCSGEVGESVSIQMERPIALERMSRAVSRLGNGVDLISERKVALGDEATSISVIERLQSVCQSLEAYVSTVPLTETSGALENNVDTLVVESLVRPLEELSRKLDNFSVAALRTPGERDVAVANLETSMIEMRTRLEALTVALETYESESGEQGITELHADLVKFLRYTMDDASERLAKLKTKRIRVSQESQARKISPALDKLDDDESVIESSEPEETNVLQELAEETNVLQELAEETNVLEELAEETNVLEELAEETAEIMKSVSVPTIAGFELAKKDARIVEAASLLPTIDEKSSPESEQVQAPATKPEKPSTSIDDEPLREITERSSSAEKIICILPELDTALSLPEMLLDPLIDVQANLSDVISDFESQESAEESSLPGNSELAACLTELRESVATAAHTATTLKSADTVDALVDLREPLLDLQLAMTSAVSPAEVKLIREATAPLSELKVILAAVIGSPQTSEASQVQMKSVLRMLEDIAAEVTKLSSPEDTSLPAVATETPEIKTVPTRPPEEVERAAIALTGVHFVLSTVLERVALFPIGSDDRQDPECEQSSKLMAERSGRSNLIVSIEELRQSVGNLAVAIGTPVVLSASSDSYSYEIVFEELAKLEEPLLNLQRVLLTEQHDPEDRHLLNDLAAPIRSLKEIVQNVSSEMAGATTPAVLDLIEDVEKDVTLIAMEALKRALATKSETTEGYDNDPRASISSSSKPGELPGVISTWLDPIEDWLTSSAVETTEINARPAQTVLAPVIDNLKREMLKIAIRTSYSEPPSDAALIESLTELNEPLTRVYEALTVCHGPENLEIVEGLVQPAKHLLGTILDASVVHEAGKVLRPVLEAIEELENQIPLTIKRIVYERELQRVVRSMTPDESFMAEDMTQAHDNTLVQQPVVGLARSLEKVTAGVSEVHVEMEERVGSLHQDSTSLEDKMQAKMTESFEDVTQSSKATAELRDSVKHEQEERSSPGESAKEQVRVDATETAQGKLRADDKSEERADTFEVQEVKSPESVESEAETSTGAPDFKKDIPDTESASIVREGPEESSDMKRKKMRSEKDEASTEQEKMTAVAELENSQSETVEVITVDSRPFTGTISPLESRKSGEGADTTRADQLDLWTLTLLGPLDRLGNAVLSLDRSIDELAHGLLCRPLDSLHKQIEIAESQFNRPVGQSLENDVETIIEGFLSPVNQLHSALGAAVNVWNDEQPRIVVRDLLRSIADSSTELCVLLDTLSKKLTVRRAEQTLQEQQEDASLVETINAVVAPLEDVKNLIEDALRSLEFVESSGEIEPSGHQEKKQGQDVTIRESLEASAIPREGEISLEGSESLKTSIDKANIKSEETLPTDDTLLRGEEESGKFHTGEAVESSPQEKVLHAPLTRAAKVKEDSMDIEETTAKPLEELIEAIVDSSLPRPVSSSPETHYSLTPEVPEENADKREILSAQEGIIAAGFVSTADIGGVESIQKARILSGENLVTAEILPDVIVSENRENLAENIFNELAAETLREDEAEGVKKDQATFVDGENLSRVEIIAGPEIGEAARQAVMEILAKATDVGQITEKEAEPTNVQRMNQAEEIEDKIQEGKLENARIDDVDQEKVILLAAENLEMAKVQEQKSLALEAPAVSQKNVLQEGVTEILVEKVISESAELRESESLAKVAIAETPELRIKPNDETAEELEVTCFGKVDEAKIKVHEEESFPKANVADAPEFVIKEHVAESSQLKVVDESFHDTADNEMDQQIAQGREGQSLAEAVITDAPELGVQPRKGKSLDSEIAEESAREISIEKIQPVQPEIEGSEGLGKAEITEVSETRIREQTVDVIEESVREVVEKSEQQTAEIVAGESLLEAVVTGVPETKIQAIDSGVSQSVPKVAEEGVQEILSQESNERKVELRDEGPSLVRAETDVAETREAEHMAATVEEVVQEMREERLATDLVEDRRCVAQIAKIKAAEVAKMSAEFVVETAKSAIVEIIETPTQKIFKLKKEETGEGENAEMVEKIIVKPVEEVVAMEDRNIVEIVETPSEKVIKVRIPVDGKDTAREEVIKEIVVKKSIEGWAKSIVEEEKRASSVSEAKVQEFVALSVPSDLLQETGEIAQKDAEEMATEDSQLGLQGTGEKVNEEMLEMTMEEGTKSLAEEKEAERAKLEESERLKREEKEVRKTEAEKAEREKIERQDKIKEEERLKREEDERAKQESEVKERKMEAERLEREELERQEKAKAETELLRQEEEEKLREETDRLECERQAKEERERREKEKQEVERVRHEEERLRKEKEEIAKLRKEEAKKLEQDQLEKAEKEKEAEKLRKEEAGRLEKEESERRKQEAERAQKEAAEKLEQGESERKAQETERARQEEAERLELEESRKRQEEDNLKKEEEERRAKEEAEKLQREQQEAERLKQEQLERAMNEKEERRQKEEAEKLEREKRESARLKQEELERAKKEEEERLKKEEAEKLEKEKLEHANKEEERLKKEEADRLKKEEEERLKNEEAEKLERKKLERAKKEEEERMQREEAEKLEKEKLERAKKEEEERLKREEAEKLERETLERAKREEEERIKQAEADKLEEENLERAKKEEEERVEKEEAEKLEREKLERAKREEEERVKKAEAEKLEEEKLERTKKKEEERLEKEEAEKLEREKLERAKKEEEKRVEREEVERLERETLERAKKEEDRVKKAEAERLEKENLERAKKEEEEERIKKAEAEKLEKENLERAQKEEERLKREEAERLEREKLERLKKEEEERLRKEEEEQLKKEETEKLKKEKQERARKEEQLKREEAERLEMEKLEREKKEEERLKIEEEEKLKRDEEERLRRQEEKRLRREEEDRLKREEEQRLKREEEERLKREEEERLKREEEERLKREEEERLKREDEERLKRDEEERLKREEQERLKREETERLENEKLERARKEKEQQLEREKAEKLEKEKLQRAKKEEEERLKREEAERLEKEKIEHEKQQAEKLKREELERAKKAEEERIKREEAEKLEKEKLERAKKEEEERIKREEAERVEKEKLEHEKQQAEKLEREELERAKKTEEERLKREEAEKLEREKLEREKQEAERLKREESERAKEKEQRLKQEEAERLEKEKLERARKEEEERLVREKQEQLEREKQEDGRKKQEELLEKAELAKLEKEKLEREEAERRKREEEKKLEKEKLETEEAERRKREEEEKLEKEKLEREEAGRRKREEEEKRAKEAEAAEHRKKEEAEKLEKETLAKEKEDAEKQKKKEFKRAERLKKAEEERLKDEAERQKNQEPELVQKTMETDKLENADDHQKQSTEKLKKEEQQNEEKSPSTPNQETDATHQKEKDTKQKPKDDTKRSKKEDSKDGSRRGSKKEGSKEGTSPRVSKKEESKEGSSPRVSKKEQSKEGSSPRVSKKEGSKEESSPRVSKKDESKEGSSPRVSKKEGSKDGTSPRISKKVESKEESRRYSKKEDDPKSGSRRTSAEGSSKEGSRRDSRKDDSKDEDSRVSKKEIPKDESTRLKKEDSKDESPRVSKKDEADTSREESRRVSKRQDSNEATRLSSRKEDSESQRGDQSTRKGSKEFHAKDDKAFAKVPADEETLAEQVKASEIPAKKQKAEEDKRTRKNDEAETRENPSERHVRLEEETSSDREAPPNWTIRTDSELDSEHSESTKSMISRDQGLPPKSQRRRSGQLAMTENDPPKEPHDRQEAERQLSGKLRDDTLSSDDQRHYTPHYSTTIRTREFTPGPRDRGKKPSFCTKLTDRTAAEGSRIKLTCTVLGDPEPGVYWTKDGRELPSSSNRHCTIEEYGMCSLELYAAMPKDSGEYSCVAQNMHGLAHTEAKLKVYAGYEPLPTRPTFTRSIKDTYRTAENELVLECRVRGQPSPKITWLKDGQVLQIGDRYQQSDLGDGICRLKISRPDFYDSGLYSCRAENDSKVGDCTSHVVNFDGKDGEEHRPRWRGSYRSLTSSDGDVGRPRFSSHLTDHSVPAGGTIALQVEVKGVPQPDITWMRGDKREPISAHKARTFADAGVYTLIVPEASESETGTYVCRASNAYGFVDTSANVEVVPSCPGEGGKPAMFVSRPAETMIHVTVGEDVSVSFRVSGVPKPRIVWMKGLRDITNGPRSYKESSDDYVRLTLKRAAIEDEGTYCIMAKNRYGCDRTFYTVKVKQRARSLTPSPDWGTLDTDNLLTSIHDTERSYLKQVPGPITSEPVVVDGGRNWLALSWGKAVQHGPAPVVAYRVDAWLLGGEGGARWAELGITPVNAFDAFNLRPGGEYKFRVTPRNRYGWGETITTRNSITVREVVKFPEFTKILPGQLKALRGETLHLECEVRSESRADVKWYRDTTDVETIHDPRYMTHYHGLKCTMTIQSIKENDSGRYVCEATNPAGRVSTFARVQVVTDPKIVEADEKLRRMRTLEPDNEERPPEFTMRLRDRRVQMTYPVRLTCQVSGHPEPEITWYKNREKIYPDDNISFWDDESHFHTLEISHSSIEDSGIYMAKARNLNGSVSCRCHLVVDKGIRAYVAPEFFRHLDAVYTVKLDGELRMTAQIEAYPTIGIVWHRDGHRLRPSRSTVMTLNHDGSVELSLAHVTPRDAGLYCCTATNEVGRAESTTRVTVIGSMDEEISSISQSLPDVVESLDVPYSKEPVFVTKPLSTEAFEGDTVIILCEVIGDPKPEVVWLRDFLRPDYYRDAPHFRRVGAGPQYRLEIPYAKLDFTGAYTVIAKNCHGEAKAIISLQIYARGQGKSDSGMEHTSIKHGKVQTLPSIKQPLRDLRCCDGDAVTLICRVHATPEPDVRWEKSGKLLPLGEDFAADFDGETARLSIQHVYPEDEGEYTCVAYNDLGKAFTSACLIVDVPEGKESALSRRLIRPIGLLSGESTPISTPRSTPIRSLSPACITSSRREPKPAVRPPRSRSSLARRPRLPTGPKFYAVPHNRVAEEGETVRFQCAIAGHPTPWVIWDKDGVPVTPTTRISLTEKDDVRILEIAEINHEDAGLYRITLENDVGRTEATARLEIIRGRQGSVARTVRTRSASPRTYSIYSRSPITSAIRGDTHLRPYAHDSTSRRGGTLSPTLPRWQHRNGKSPAESSDPARRTNDQIRTTRKNGTAQNSPSPKVPVSTKVARSASMPRQHLTHKEIPVNAAKSTTKSLAPRQTNEGNKRSNGSLRPTTTTNGSMIPMRVGNLSRSRSPKVPDIFIGSESPRDHQDLGPGSTGDYQDLGPGSLQEPQDLELSGESHEISKIPKEKIVPVKIDDTIEFAGLEVRNEEFPDAKKQIQKENSRFFAENTRGTRPPVILAAPADVIALRGTKVMLLATFDGEPQPRVRWLRKGRDVRLDDKAEIETSRGLTCLTLDGVTTEQTGKYAVTLENIAGRDCRYVDLTVEGVPDPPAGKPCVQSITRSGKAIVTWRSPSYDGGCAVTGYSVEMKRSEDPCWVAVAEAHHSLSHTVTGLETENTYSFRVRAENAHGLSEPGTTSDIVTVPGENDEEIGSQVFTAEINQIEEEEDEFEPTFEARIVTPEDGSLFGERYEVKEELGKGRYGLVRRIIEKSSGLILAAKFVRTIKAKDRQQAHEEIDIMNRLRHPKLLRLAAAFENPKEMIMVTEYISGGELFERVVADDFTLTEKDSILFVKQICEGVEYMHSQYIVHLDLKPENIMCHTRTTHRIKLIDFGLAQTLNPDTPVRVLFGTPEFIPPEIIGFEPIGTESDMWSVGVICYVLLTGLSPFMGDNDAETFANITRADYDFDDKAFTAISAEAKDFISALLVKRKELRMSARQCLEHPWLAQQAESMSRVALPTDKLKKFIVRRKWQKTGNAIRALGRMATLSANSRRNLSAASSPAKSSIDDELFGDVAGNGGEAFRPIQPVVVIEDKTVSEDLADQSFVEPDTRPGNDEEEGGVSDREDVTRPEVSTLSELARPENEDFQNGDENFLSVTELEEDVQDHEANDSEDNLPLIQEIDDIIGRDELTNEYSATVTSVEEITNDVCNVMEITEAAKIIRDTFCKEATRKQSFSSFVNLEITEAGTVDIRVDNETETGEPEDGRESSHGDKNGQAEEEDEDEEKTQNFSEKAAATENILEEHTRESHDTSSRTPVVTRVWCKTGNSISGDEEDENARLTTGVGGLGRACPFVRTGSVSRTAKMFEQVDETNTTLLIKQQINPLNRTAPILSETRPHNERIRKAFAFWNK